VVTYERWSQPEVRLKLQVFTLHSFSDPSDREISCSQMAVAQSRNDIHFFLISMSQSHIDSLSQIKKYQIFT